MYESLTVRGVALEAQAPDISVTTQFCFGEAIQSQSSRLNSENGIYV